MSVCGVRSKKVDGRKHKQKMEVAKCMLLIIIIQNRDRDNAIPRLILIQNKNRLRNKKLVLYIYMVDFKGKIKWQCGYEPQFQSKASLAPPSLH